MSTGGIQSVIPSATKVGRLPGGGMPGQGKNPGKAKGKFDVSLLEIEGGHLVGGTGNVTTVLSVRDAHAGGQTL